MTLSIITINLNNASGLGKTIESVLSQTYQDIEFIIIDGASSDGSMEVIRQFDRTTDQLSKNRITNWVSEKDTGIYNALNKGIRKASGEYCLFLNSGDSFRSNSILSELFEQKFDEDIVYCDAVLTKEGKEFFKYILPEKLSLYFLYFNSICHQATLIKRSLFNILGFYNENNQIISDWEFIFKAVYSDICTFKHIPVFLSGFELGGISTIKKEQTAFERNRFLSSVLPEKVQEDYLFFNKQNENTVFKSVGKLKAEWTKTIAITFIKILSRIENILVK